MPRAIGNPQRGCGTLKQGGFYARSEFSPRGTLQMSWCFGAGVVKGHNLFIEGHGDRGMGMCVLPSTLHAGFLTQAPYTLAGTYPALDALKQTALVDHVGSNNYTPLSFAEEVQRLGVNRRVPEVLARKLAGKSVPILFTHSDLPVLPGALPPDEFQLDDQGGQLEIDPSFYNREWGIMRGCDDGSRHWLLNFLQAAEADDTLFNQYGAQPREQAFFLSWITNIVYVASPEDDPARRQEIEAAGIEIVTTEAVV